MSDNNTKAYVIANIKDESYVLIGITDDFQAIVDKYGNDKKHYCVIHKSVECNNVMNASIKNYISYKHISHNKFKRDGATIMELIASLREAVNEMC